MTALLSVGTTLYIGENPLLTALALDSLTKVDILSISNNTALSCDAEALTARVEASQSTAICANAPQNCCGPDVCPAAK